jgi:uncharacterized protein YndB with AHSA1/START domain
VSDTRSRVLVALRVPATPRRAFDAFTQDIGRWWRPNQLFRFSRGKQGTLVFEPGPGGRLVEHHDDGSFTEIGRITLWEPPHRLALTWRHDGFTPEQETEVLVRFEDVGDTGTVGGHSTGREVGVGTPETRVVVEHFGWDGIPAEHVARHGFPLPVFQQRLAEWWQTLLGSLASSLDR